MTSLCFCPAAGEGDRVRSPACGWPLVLERLRRSGLSARVPVNIVRATGVP